MRLDHRPVGALLIDAGRSADRDGIAMSILETAANQIVAALRNAWLLEHAEDLRRQAVAGRAEAERQAEDAAWGGRGPSASYAARQAEDIVIIAFYIASQNNLSPV